MAGRTYVFAGATSAMAVQAAKMLHERGDVVIGISTKHENPGYDQFYTVDSYASGKFPTIEGPVNGLAYFPGTINLKPFHRLSEADFLSDFTINTLGAAAFVQAYLPALKIAEDPAVLFFSTVAVATGMPFHASVAMAKGAVEGLTRSLAAEYAPKIRFNCIAPSLTDTPLAGKLLGSEEKTEAGKNRNPLKKIGSTQDLANAIVFLLSDTSAWITGQVLPVDGGMGVVRLL
ncbi:SDR family oxidoreductase [Flavobacterium zepuense]|uniref:SDR family oxidoreductase n=1 Tax=Flavobacterium zepuense TaxID=2593302 RepID=A0A552UWH4_9FLAO|nr:SDR family oxidoreductase [Flavobacterium zepuense]TRW22559.1 SDR family oxidoreductase [Flavobacterium zepuense]